MTTRRLLWTVLRWLPPFGVTVVALYGWLLVSFFLVTFGHFPRLLTESTAAFGIGFLAVSVGSLTASSHRLTVAIVLFVLSVGMAPAKLAMPATTVALGGACAVMLVAWVPKRTPRSTRWVFRGALVLLVGFALLAAAAYVDWPARKDPLPNEIVGVLGTRASRVEALYVYDLGGFLDHDWLWRIEAGPDVMALLVQSWDARPTDDVPAGFWRMSPHYWPHTMPVGAKAYRSSRFPDEGRGPDGNHYLVVHDEARREAFVWFKANF